MPSYEELKDEGDTALAIGELEQAVDYYRQATVSNPAYFDAWHALSMALLKLQRFPEAIEAGKKATEIDPNNQFGWTSLSLAYVRNNMIPEAEAAGAKAKIISWGGKVKIENSEKKPE
jgi:tetratricopeptide (TPR) repeat protein